MTCMDFVSGIDKRFCFVLIIVLTLFSSLFAQEAILSNDFYSVSLNDDHTFLVDLKQTDSFVCSPTFTVISSSKDPQLAMRPGGIGRVSYNIATWKVDPALLKKEAALKNIKKNAATAGDGFDDSILKGRTDGRTADLFYSGQVTVVTADAARLSGNSIVFTFEENPSFTLKATLTLSDICREPVLEYSFVPKQKGYYSVGFTGLGEYKLAEVDEIWQPMIWQEKRFPDMSYMTLAYRCTIPATMVCKDGQCVALIADPREMSFDPLPVLKNSRFGVAVRNLSGNAQPMVFAPALGGQESLIDAGEVFNFRMRLFVSKGNCSDAYEKIAREVFGFSDYRSNNLCSLNETFENMLDYGMSEYSRFFEDLKGCEYSTDVPGAVKNVSSLNPLNMAIVTDDSEIYRKRAYPLMEYMLSREKFLFCLNREQKIQNPSRAMKGPCAPLTELGALYDVFQKSNPVLLTLAEKMYGSDRTLNLDVVEKGKSWKNSLAMYRASGDKRYLERAIAGADDYLARRVDVSQTDFVDPDAGGLFFWTGFAPKWIDFIELYEQTGYERYLKAAQAGARLYAMYIWMCPTIPEKDIVVNKDGKAPLYWYLKSKGHNQMYLPQELAPAWRLSEIGLTPESSGTCAGHRGIFMANYAPWMLRLGYYANDSFLSDIARAAVIGRYRNFPGYHINTARTTAYEKADYPLREHKDLSVNSFHYNHIWPMMSMLFDYLVTDTFVRSEGQIDFPSQFIEGYAYLQNKFYGHKTGKWYGLEDVQLWMPKGLIDCDNVELNYISARAGGKLLLAFTNQSSKKVNAHVTLNNDLVGAIAARKKLAKVRTQNGTARSLVVDNGRFNVAVEAKGITTVEINDVRIKPKFQALLLDCSAMDAWEQDYLEMDFGNGRAMILNGGENNTAYIYLQADDDVYREVSLRYQDAGEWETVVDKDYPFEYTIAIDKGAGQLKFMLSGVDFSGRPQKSEILQLRRKK